MLTNPHTRNRPSLDGVGVGLRARHFSDFLNDTPPVDWLEVHSENYFGDGGYELHVLETLRERYPISLHGVGLSLGSADALRDAHIAKLKRLVKRIEPALVSEHLCWAAYGGRHYNDLLPIPYTEEALTLITQRVQMLQEALGRQVLIENVSSYLEYRASTMGEFEFLAALAERTGCGLLLDVNNVYVNAVNHDTDAEAALAVLPHAAVKEIHLAGHSIEGDCLIDDHGSRVVPAVWRLYEQALQRFGPVPTLIEWDTAVPPLSVLLEEASQARQRMKQLERLSA